MTSRYISEEAFSIIGRCIRSQQQISVADRYALAVHIAHHFEESVPFKSIERFKAISVQTIIEDEEGLHVVRNPDYVSLDRKKRERRNLKAHKLSLESTDVLGK